MKSSEVRLVSTLFGLLLLSRCMTAQDVQHGTGATAASRGPLPVQSERLRPMSPQDFGVGNVNILQIPAVSFLPASSSVTWSVNPPYVANPGYLYPTGAGVGEFLAGANLPEGALIDALVLYYDDPSVDHSVFVGLYALTGWDETNAGGTLVASAVSSGSSGKGYVTTSVSHSVKNSVFLGGAQYVVYVQANGIDPATGFRAVEIWWERQLSPAPAAATFADVPTNHPFFRVIEALAASGITSGCGGGNFCPDQPVTRGEIAKFFARALGLSYNDNLF